MTRNFGASSGVVYVKNVSKLLVVGGKKNMANCRDSTAQISPGINNPDGKWFTNYGYSDIPRRIYHCQVFRMSVLEMKSSEA